MFGYDLDGNSELRLLEERHARELTDYDRQHLRAWLPWLDDNRTVEDRGAFIRGTLKQLANNDGFQAGIWYEGKLAGIVGYHGIDWVSPAQARTLLSAAREDRLEALYVLAVHAGLRQGELLGLRWEDVDLDAGTLQVRRTLTGVEEGSPVFTAPKTAKSRRGVKLTAAAADTLRRHRKRQLEERMARAGLWRDLGLVFTTEVGTPLNRRNLSRRSFKPLLRRAELPEIRFHDLRHTCATVLLSKGVHPKFVQELLGHATIAITLDTYSHVLPGMGNQTADAMEAALAKK